MLLVVVLVSWRKEGPLFREEFLAGYNFWLVQYLVWLFYLVEVHVLTKEKITSACMVQSVQHIMNGT